MNPVDAIKLLGGKIGSAANRILTATPKPIKSLAGVAANITTGGAVPADIYTKERGVTEALQSQGGQVLAAQDPKAAEIKAQQTAGFPSAVGVVQNKTTQVQTQQPTGTSEPTYNPNSVSELKSERAMGANVGDIRDFGGIKWRWDGNTWTQEQTPGASDSGLSGEDISNTVKSIPGASDFLDEGTLQSIMDKYAGASRDRAGDLAAEIEAAATENANREYAITLEALGVQKKEVGTLKTQQTERLKTEAKMNEEGLSNKQETETKSIEKQKAGFEEETQNTKEEMAKNWRDLSMEIQRISRARGIADSAFAASKETGVLMDFNKGLRKIATDSTAALKDFADAVTETTKFYTREKEKLAVNLTSALQDVDNWERQQVQSIQAQENVALNNKLSDIRNAVVEAKQLRVQTEQKIADQQLALGTWLVQFQAQMKAAVATAANGKVDDAWKNISNVRQNATIVNTLLQNGGEIVPQKDDKGNITGGTLHGYLPTADGSYEEVTLPLTAGFTQTTTLQTAANIAGKTPTSTTDQVYQQLYGSTPGGQTENQDLTNLGPVSSILSKIGL